MALKIHSVEIGKINPAAYNPRSISPEALEGLKTSLKRFGFVDPLVVNKRTGNLVGGHQRLRAATEMGHKSVPVVYVDLSDIEEKALNVTLNNSKIMGDYTADLAALLEEIKVEFSEEEFEALRLDDIEIPPLEEEPQVEVLPPGDPDHVPEAPVNPKVVRGEVYVLGKHRLMCGDSTSIDDVEKLMAGGKADCVFTDPPYNLEENGLLKRTNKGGEANHESFGSWDVGFDPMLSIPIILAAIKPNASVFVATSHILFGAFIKGLTDAGGKTSNLVWCKKNPMPSLTKKSFVHATELIVYSRFGSPFFNYPNEGNLKNWFEGNVEPHTSGHPSQKPVYVPKFCIEPSTKKGDVVLDLFGGSGSTMIACEELGLASRLIELDPKYCAVILDRWQKFTGKKAHREDGKSWDEIKGE